MLASCGGTGSREPTKSDPGTGQATARSFESDPLDAQLGLDSIWVRRFLLAHPQFHVDSTAILDFYRGRGYQYAWFVKDQPQEAVQNFVNLVGVIDTSAGPQAAQLARDLHELCVLVQRFDTLPPSDSLRAATELLLTGQFFHLAGAEYGGQVTADLRELDWYIPRRKKNYAVLLEALTSSYQDLSAIEPVNRRYKLLKAQLKRYVDLDKEGDWPPIVPSDMDTLVQGGTSPSVPLLRERLQRLGDLKENSGSDHFDAALAEAVSAFQERMGLPLHGMVDAEVLNALNVPPTDRLRTIMVNMERLRWVPEQLPTRIIVVNIPEFRLHVMEHDVPVLQMDVVVGTTVRRTLIFRGQVTEVVFAPYWNIPARIVQNEIMPAAERDPGYLRRNHIEQLRTGGMRQRPGPQNALGRVKFLFPNPYMIYLHDTPAKDRFAQRQRTFSHGCIRVSDARALALYLLKDDPEWPPDAIDKAMEGRSEITVHLSEGCPVAITYFTAWVDAQGRLNFRDDVYGHDARLAGVLFQEGLP